MAPNIDTLLHWWFGDWTDNLPLPDNDPQMRKWWRKHHDDDRHIIETFGPWQPDEAWATTPSGALAEILLLDQVSRVVHRGKAEAFTNDPAARTALNRALDRDQHRQLRPIECCFLYMPLMHSEDPADHIRSITLFTELVEATAHTARAKSYTYNLKAAQDHQRIVDRFGRYPHRNHALGRTSTPEELAFLTQPGSSF
jgi:uncharacterized protein (DUF924 family)